MHAYRGHIQHNKVQNDRWLVFIFSDSLSEEMIINQIISINIDPLFKRWLFVLENWIKSTK